MSEAAQRAGQPLDQWLKSQLLASNAGVAQTAAAGGGTVEDLQRRIQELSGAIDRLVVSAPAATPAASAPGGYRPSAPPPSAPPPASADTKLDAALRQINERIDAMHAPRQRPGGAATSERFEQRMNDIVRTAEAVGRRDYRTDYRPSAAPGPEAIEAAVAEIAARQHELDRGFAERNLAERNLTERKLTERAADEHRRTSERPAAPAPALPPLPSPVRTSPPVETLGTLQRELAEMRQLIGALAPRRAVDELQRTVTRLVERSELTEAGDEELRGTLLALRDMIVALKLPEHPAVLLGRIETLERKIDIVNAKSVDGAAIARLQAQASEIRDLLGRALSTDTLRLLADQVALLATKVSQMPVVDEGMIRSAVGTLERRIDTLADRLLSQPAPTLPLDDIFRRLDSIQQNLVTARREAPAGMEQLFRGLSDRIERIERPVSLPDPSPHFDALSRQVAEIAQKLDAATTPSTQITGQLAGIERAVNDLFIQMEETRATVLANAGHRPRSNGGTGAASLLKREVAAVEASRAPAAPPPATPVVAEAPAMTPPPPQAMPAQPVFTPPPASIPKEFEPQLMRAALEELARSPQAASAYVPPAPAPAAKAAPAFLPDDDPPVPGALGDEFDFNAAVHAAKVARAGAATPAGTAAEEHGKPAADGPNRAQFIAQARRASQPASVVLPEMHSRIGERHQRQQAPSSTSRWLARIRAMLLIGICGSGLAYGSWHLLGVMREGQQRAAIPAAGLPNLARPAAPNVAPGSAPLPDDITGSVGAPRAPAPAPALAPPAPAATPGPSSMSAPGDLPSSIGSQALRAAALSGDANAAYEMGHRFLEGIGIPSNAARAAEWFAFAGEHGSIPALYRLGSLYEKGAEGVTRDVARARSLYTRAAVAGNVRAMHNLGVLLAAGVDGQPDYREAAVWFTRAAEHGVRDSQFNLAVLYARGFGVSTNLLEAWRWFSVAAAGGDAEAGAKRDEIAAKLDASTLASARVALEQWTPTQVDAQANGGSGQDWDQTNPVPRKTASR
ncbi:hypothetical protein ACO2RV_19780 [Ancylobacter sp. VNQ12]|uniref:hypothetical protein n=1 Tax=Ancylobacter sp. VNQ12 TaxID=3400920 RepID=UPI003C023F39